MTIQEKVIKKGEDDWVYLAEVVVAVREEMPDASEPTIIECTLRILRDLIEGGLIVIGDLPDAGSNFIPWPLSTTEALNRVRNEWAALNRPINLGDVCWLSNTPEGDKRAASLPNIVG